MHDQIVKETRKQRNLIAKQFNFNIDKICSFLENDQKKYGGRVVKLKPKRLIASVISSNGKCVTK